MNSEKVKEIKKALEVYCKENKGITILRGGEIQAIPYADILTLINELESENERLLEQRNKTYNIWVKDTEQLKEQIAELEKENKRLATAEAELQELNIKYYNEAKDLRRQLADIEAENERLSEKLGQILLSIDTVKEMNAMCNIDDHRKQAVNEFAERIKNEVYPFLQAEMYNKKYFITGNIESDICREHQNQNIGIIKAQDVLSKWFKVKIDELLKEYE